MIVRTAGWARSPRSTDATNAPASNSRAGAVTREARGAEPARPHPNDPSREPTGRRRATAAGAGQATGRRARECRHATAGTGCDRCAARGRRATAAPPGPGTPRSWTSPYVGYPGATPPRGSAGGGGGVVALAEWGVVADDGLDLADGEVEGGAGGHGGQGAGLAGGGLPGDVPDDVGAGVIEVVWVFAVVVVAVVIGGPLEDVGASGVLGVVGDVEQVGLAGALAGDRAAAVAFAHVPDRAY